MYKVTAYFRKHKITQKFHDLYDAIDFKDSADAHYPLKVTFRKVIDMREWMISTATILFDDSKNDFRALPKVVRFQILTTLSFVWSTAFTIYIWGHLGNHADVWLGLVIGHIAIICAVYYTFKQFHMVGNNRTYDFTTGYHSLGRTRSFMIGRDKKGNPYKVYFDKDDPGGEHE